MTIFNILIIKRPNSEYFDHHNDEDQPGERGEGGCDGVQGEQLAQLQGEPDQDKSQDGHHDNLIRIKVKMIRL